MKMLPVDVALQFAFPTFLAQNQLTTNQSKGFLQVLRVGAARWPGTAYVCSTPFTFASIVRGFAAYGKEGQNLTNVAKKENG